MEQVTNEAPQQLDQLARNEKLADLLWAQIDQQFIEITAIIVICWIISIAATHQIKQSVPDTPTWKLKVRAWAVGIAFLFALVLLPLSLSPSTLYAKVVLIVTLATACGVTAPLIFDPVLRRFLWPMILRPVLGIFLARFRGGLPEEPPTEESAPRKRK